MFQFFSALWLTFFVLPGIPLLVLWEKVTGYHEELRGKSGIGILFKRATIAASVVYAIVLGLVVLAVFVTR